jgi:RNA polymerase II subunit A small phosphatase-like protein
VLADSQNEKDYLRVADEAPEVPKKNRGLLHVPSRSSSHKIQPSPTSTGLSGVTATDPEESIGGRSKGSNQSGRRRHGSTSSSKMSTTQDPSTGPTGNNSSNSNATNNRQPKKKSAIFSFLSCCIAPEDANTVDASGPLAANKVTKVPSGRPTTASRPEQPIANQQNNSTAQAQTEKDALKRDEPRIEGNGANTSEAVKNTQVASSVPAVTETMNQSANPRDQPLPDLPQEAESSKAPVVGLSNPVPAFETPIGVNVEPVRPQISSDAQVDDKDLEGDVKMAESETSPTDQEEVAIPVPKKDEPSKQQQVLPPPPPVPQQPGSSDDSAPDATEQKQQWLLPPIAPRFQGKKCLVLDLDETLVHSSFKVYQNPILNVIRG